MFITRPGNLKNASFNARLRYLALLGSLIPTWGLNTTVEVQLGEVTSSAYNVLVSLAGLRGVQHCQEHLLSLCAGNFVPIG